MSADAEGQAPFDVQRAHTIHSTKQHAPHADWKQGYGPPGASRSRPVAAMLPLPGAMRPMSESGTENDKPLSDLKSDKGFERT